MPSSDSLDRDHVSSSASRLAPVSRRSLLALLGLGGLGVAPGTSLAHHEGETTNPDGPDTGEIDLHGPPDPNGPLIARDEATSGVVSDGPSANVTKNLAVAGRGERVVPNATTDVWAHDGFAYIGTFNDPCGTGEGFGEDRLVDDLEGPGVPVFDVRNPNRPRYVGSLPSLEGSRINDVKVGRMIAGDILVHSNESCAGGPGGFEIYDVDDPTAPVHLASVRIDEINPISDALFGGITDVGVHNLFLFRQGERDYVSAVAETAFHNFQTWDITDPTDPQRVSAWGAEELFDPGVGDETENVGRVLDAAIWLLDGFGTSRKRFLHDITVNDDGTRAYLANWDAGVVLHDISDPANPQVISVALDSSAGDGEVNSHNAWPSEDGRVVVETEEDFDPFALTFRITEGPNAGTYEAAEGAFTTPIFLLENRTMSGQTTYLGLACDSEGIPEATEDGEIAVIQRGDCRFDRKAEIAIEAGYDGMVVFNAEGDEAVIPMGGEPRDIPGVFVGHSTGLAIFDVADLGDLSVGDTGASIEAVAEPERWGNVRIWDYSDEENPVLASEFDTRCSFDPAHQDCDPRGTYSVHNVIVERDRAYISWYSDGVLVLDISDPYNPVEIARYSPGDDEFEEQNGGIQDVWGVYKEPRKPWIYASDRNGGLYVLKELGSGADKRNR